MHLKSNSNFTENVWIIFVIKAVWLKQNVWHLSIGQYFRSEATVSCPT